jgi:hypothetical protein
MSFLLAVCKASNPVRKWSWSIADLCRGTPDYSDVLVLFYYL